MTSCNSHWTPLVWLTVCLCFGQSWHGVSGLTDLHQKMEYHLTELRKGLYQMQSSSHVHKRSADLDHNAIIYQSFMAFCSQMTTENSSITYTITKTPEITDLSSGILPTAIPLDKKYHQKSSQFPLLDPVPVKVQAERIGKKVWVVFDIIHSSSAYVARVFSFDYKKTDLVYPYGLWTPVLSKARFEIDASLCGDEETDSDITADFVVEAQGKNSTYVSVDVCLFDKVRNETEHRWETRKEKKIISEDIPQPLFKVFSGEGNRIVVEEGKNATFEIDVHLFLERRLDITVRVWDRDQGKVLKSMGNLNVRYDGEEGINALVETRDWDNNKHDEGLLSLDVINQTVHKFKASPEYSPSKNVSARVKVTVNTDTGTKSGRLTLAYIWRESRYYQRPIVRMVRAAQDILLVIPKKPGVLPRNDVEIYHREFRCDNRGMRVYPKNGRNCTVMCSAYGHNIHSVTIRKHHPRITPVRSVSSVLGGSAFAMWDVGPASRSIEGKYKCVVALSSGKRKKQDMTLYTPPFNSLSNFTVTEFSNGTTKLGCTGLSIEPLTMTLSTTDVNKNEPRKLPPSPTWLITKGNEMTLISIVSTSALKYPRERVNCEVSGDRGTDGHSVDLYSYIENQNPYEPKINKMPNATFISVYGNGTVGVTCAATGKDFTMIVTRGTPDREDRIDDKPENQRLFRETDEGQTITLLVPTESLSTGSRDLYCVITNQFIDNIFELNLSSVGL